MKVVKRLACLVAAALLAVTTAAAADFTPDDLTRKVNVWIDNPVNTGMESQVTVPIMTDGTSTDGLISVFYDADVLRLHVGDAGDTYNPGGAVKPVGVTMYSANVPEQGELLISWIVGGGYTQRGYPVYRYF